MFPWKQAAPSSCLQWLTPNLPAGSRFSPPNCQSLATNLQLTSAAAAFSVCFPSRDVWESKSSFLFSLCLFLLVPAGRVSVHRMLFKSLPIFCEAYWSSCHLTEATSPNLSRDCGAITPWGQWGHTIPQGGPGHASSSAREAVVWCKGSLGAALNPSVSPRKC